MKPNCDIKKDVSLYYIGIQVNNILKAYGKESESIDFSNRLWCCTTKEEVLSLAANFINIKFVV